MGLTYQRDAIETERYVPGTRRGDYALSYSSNDNPSSLAADAEGQMARFATKTLRVCSGLVVLTYCT